MFPLGDPAISIHALLAESDPGQPGHHRHHSHFYPRSPCGERHGTAPIWRRKLPFLSTLSLRRATRTPFWLRRSACYFYPRSPCGERRLCYFIYKDSRDFYPRSPCGERHHGHCAFGHAVDISIHALLAESDKRPKPPTCRSRYFYPRSPCGERPGTIGAAAGTAAISIHALLAESDR